MANGVKEYFRFEAESGKPFYFNRAERNVDDSAVHLFLLTALF